MAVAHQQAAVSQTEQMRRQAPHADTVRRRPRLPAVSRLGLQRLLRVHGVVVADVSNQFSGGGFDGVQFVVLRRIVTRANGHGREPVPCQAVIRGLTDADAMLRLPQFDSAVQ